MSGVPHSELGSALLLGWNFQLGLLDRHRQVLHQLLPPGKAFSREDEDLDNVVRGLAAELDRVEIMNCIAEIEQDPRTTTFEIDRWENALGLPSCSSRSEVLEDRRKAAHAKLAAQPIISRQDYIDFAERFGYPGGVITESADPDTRFICGKSRCKDSLGGGGVTANYTWIFTVGSGTNDTQLDCELQKLKPGNTTLITVFT